MFTIIGGDGKEYGPVTTDQVRAWITAGRANLDTRARAVGSEEWRRLGDFAEFSSGGVPPPLVGSGAPEFAGQALTGPTSFLPAVNSPEQELAGRGTRLGAALIDRAIAMICMVPGLVLMGPAFMTLVIAASRGEEPSFEDFSTAGLALGAFVAAAGWLIQFAVQVWMLTVRGQTIGKRLLNIRIVLFQNNSNPGFLHAWLLRNFVPGIIGLVPYVGFMFVIVDVCFIFGDQRRCIHDHIAGTKVVKA